MTRRRPTLGGEQASNAIFGAVVGKRVGPASPAVVALLALFCGCVADPAGAHDARQPQTLQTIALAAGWPCKVTADCPPSDDLCKVVACVKQECRYGPDATKPDCCSSGFNASCDDKYYLSDDKCDKKMPGGWMQCTHTVDPKKYCTPATCPGAGGCTSAYCKGDSPGDCGYGVIPGCCNKGGSCDDGVLCTTDTCFLPTANALTGSCVHDKGPGCCLWAEDCDDDLSCTTDTCDKATNTCKHVKGPAQDCCDSPSECDNGSECTSGWCVNHTCFQFPVAGKSNCPKPPKNCNDGDECTKDILTANGCAHEAVPACCPGAEGAPFCDDNCGCTLDYCVNGFCHRTEPSGGCCCSSADCDDGDPATKDLCGAEDPATGTGICEHASFCQQEPVGCDDGDPCTLDTSNGCVCSHESLQGCCSDAQDCQDDHACTVDLCLPLGCLNYVPLTDKGCCDPKHEAVDCAHLTDLGMSGKCLLAPDGTYGCGQVSGR